MAIQTELDRLGRDWALVGGLAVSTWVEPRTTQDVDIAVATTDDGDTEGLIRHLFGAGFGPAPNGQIEQEATGRLATMRLLGPDKTLVDLLFASSGIEPEITAAAVELEILPGLFAPVARPEHLLVMKVLANRPSDHIDIKKLAAVLDASQRQRAREAASLVVARGCNRGMELERLVQEALFG